MEKGDIEIYLMREVVEEVENPETQIALEDVIAITGEHIEIGGE